MRGGQKISLRSVVLLVHETLKRRETTVQDKLEVTQLTLYRVNHCLNTLVVKRTSVRKMSFKPRASWRRES